MRRKIGVSLKEANARARDCAIRAAIGKTLSAQYNLAEPLPDRLEQLLKRLDGGPKFNAIEIQRQQAPINGADGSGGRILASVAIRTWRGSAGADQ
jgi:hypothetical protein